MLIAIPKESLAGERRVAASPKSVKGLMQLGFDVVIEQGAGENAGFSDAVYKEAGAEVARGDVTGRADVVLRVNAPTEAEVDLLSKGCTHISFLSPAQNEALLSHMAERAVNALAIDTIPRISRAQSMDALSSMANIGGYRAVLEAAHHFDRFLMGQITAAGKVPPAKVLIIGAGVAGLAAIGTAGSLGAVVRAFDTRSEVKEQIESMGGSFLEIDLEELEGDGDGYAKVMSPAYIEAEMALFAEQAREVDIIITTAMIPGKPAPKLVTEAMVKSMKPGSVIVDMAAATGGNCELTEPGEVAIKHEVTLIGYTDLPSRLPTQASDLYANNLLSLMKLLTVDGQVVLDFDDDVIRGATSVKDGEVSWPPPPIKVSAAPPPKPSAAEQTKAAVEVKPPSPYRKPVAAAIGALLFLWIASVAPAEFLSRFTVFILACVVGFYLVWNVTHALHTPLMSVTNAISGIIVVGALLQVGSDNTFVALLAGIATLIATINIAGGFFVTSRMLKMFRKE